MEPQAQFVTGYYRYKKEKKQKQDGNALIGALLIISVVGIFALLLWYVTIPVGAAGFIGHKAYKHWQRSEKQKQLLQAVKVNDGLTGKSKQVYI